jgi:Kef-type K+ transport system membrane component KefB/nucleotide-binding universal stress UspA family protein
MQISLLFLQVILIVALGRVVGLLMARIRQPQVIGEMVAGIMLGPSFLGWIFPDVYHHLFPQTTWPLLAVLSQVGVVFFLFLVGLELDPKLVLSQGRAAVVISNASILVPFILGMGLTFFLYPRLLDSIPRQRFMAIALFMGAAMSITAFPVLARILTERDLHRTQIGALAITCAAFADAIAWCMLALVVAVATVSSLRMALLTLGLSAVYITLMLLLVRPFLKRLEIVYDRQGRLSQGVVSIIFLLVLVSAYTTERIGIHALFGAFLMGCIMPKGTQFVRHLSEKLEDYTVVFLLPIFFAFAGLQTQIGLLNSPTMWLYTALIIGVATVGKFGGSAVAARVSGLSWREASAIGILMNTRGLMELVILTTGLQLGVITPAVYAMMVIMALVTTAVTTPILNIVYPHRLFGKTQEPGLGTQDSTFSVLIPVSLPKSGGPLVQLADTLIGQDREHARLFAIHLKKPADHDVFRTGLDEVAQSHDETLAPLLAQARGRSIPVEQLSMVSRDIPGDISAIAKLNKVNLVLMGFHKPVIGKQILGGTVHRVLQQCESDVAIFVDRGFRTARRILVPYLGSDHDKLAMRLAARMARNIEAQVTILHVVPPMRANQQAREVLNAREAVERTFEEPGQRTPVTFRVIEDESPVGVVLHQAQTADLVIIGVAQEWGLESHLFGWRAQRIAQDCPSSLLIVRRASHGWAEASPAESSTEAQRPTLTHLVTELRQSDATRGRS